MNTSTIRDMLADSLQRNTRTAAALCRNLRDELDKAVAELDSPNARLTPRDVVQGRGGELDSLLAVIAEQRQMLAMLNAVKES